MSVRGTFIPGMMNIMWAKYVHGYVPYFAQVYVVNLVLTPSLVCVCRLNRFNLGVIV